MLKIFKSTLPKELNIVAIGSTDDAIKFIDYDHNVVEKYVGLKNYPTSFEEDEEGKMVWVSDLEGSICCFTF